MWLQSYAAKMIRVSLTECEYEQIARRIVELRDNFYRLEPFEHIVIDDFLPISFARQLLSEIKDYKPLRKSSDLFFAKQKYELAEYSSLGYASSNFNDFVLSKVFQHSLCELTGLTLFIDPNNHGGGLHLGGKGSFLALHTDFEYHPVNISWERTLNIILFLNQDWHREYRGELIMINKQTGKKVTIEPLFNRCVIMNTNSNTIHGYDSINFPLGSYRTSIALYAYNNNGYKRRGLIAKTTTTWHSKHRIFRILIKCLAYFIIFKQRIFGSRSAKA